MNSLAIRIVGPDGTCSIRSYQCSGAGESRSVSRCMSRSTGLVSTRATDNPSIIPGTALNTRSASASKVPRPGPSSATTTPAGSPIACHIEAAQMPISSPNIWLISGAVTKSPSAPSGWRVT